MNDPSVFFREFILIISLVPCFGICTLCNEDHVQVYIHDSKARHCLLQDSVFIVGFRGSSLRFKRCLLFAMEANGM